MLLMLMSCLRLPKMLTGLLSLKISFTCLFPCLGRVNLSLDLQRLLLIRRTYDTLDVVFVHSFSAKTIVLDVLSSCVCR